MHQSIMDARARIDFVLFARRAWAAQIYPALADQVREAAPEMAQIYGSTDAWAERMERVAPSVHENPIYPFFAWLERGLKRQLWRSVQDVVVADGISKVDAEGIAASSDGTLELDPNLHLPNWYSSCDFHLQPGGVWSSLENAFVYRLGAQVVMLGANDGAEFHRLFTNTAVPLRKYERIVDLGCGFGKSTFPLKDHFPGADVIGIDLAESLLRLAHNEAARRDMKVRFKQAHCDDTGLENESVDLVTATMLIHELPPDVLRSTIVEISRILRPGGVVRILDFQPTGDPIRDLAMVEHSDRNNEPYLRELFHSDVLGWCERADLEKCRWVAFDERGHGRLEMASWPTRAEWHFPWAVLEAEKALVD